jgi:hypothetical protein
LFLNKPGKLVQVGPTSRKWSVNEYTFVADGRRPDMNEFLCRWMVRGGESALWSSELCIFFEAVVMVIMTVDDCGGGVGS